MLQQKHVELKMLFGIKQVDMGQLSTEAGFSSVNPFVRGNRGIMDRACLYRVWWSYAIGGKVVTRTHE